MFNRGLEVRICLRFNFCMVAECCDLCILVVCDQQLGWSMMAFYFYQVMLVKPVKRWGWSLPFGWFYNTLVYMRC